MNFWLSISREPGPCRFCMALRIGLPIPEILVTSWIPNAGSNLAGGISKVEPSDDLTPRQREVLQLLGEGR